MDRPRQIDPCAFIRRDIEITQKLIDDDRTGLQHPEVLTHDDVVRLKADLERRGELLADFQESFRRCRAEDTRHRRSRVESGPSRSAQMATRAEQWK